MIHRTLTLLLRGQEVYVKTEGYECYSRVLSVSHTFQVTLDNFGDEWEPAELVLDKEPLNVWILGILTELRNS